MKKHSNAPKKANDARQEEKALQGFLSPQRLHELAGPKVYARGEAYLAGGAVELHEHTLDEAIGEVRGSQPYRVELKLMSKSLIADCTCPAMSDHGFCKHAVALGLYLIDAPPPSTKRSVKTRKAEPDTFTEKYPNIAAWTKMAGLNSDIMITARPSYACWMKVDWFGKAARDTNP